jgi:hypothetical protein
MKNEKETYVGNEKETNIGNDHCSKIAKYAETGGLPIAALKERGSSQKSKSTHGISPVQLSSTASLSR